MIYGKDTLKDAVADEYFSIEEELTIRSPIYSEDILSIDRDKKLKWNQSRPVGRLESLDVYSRLAPDGSVPPLIFFYHCDEPLTDSYPFLVREKGVIDANISGRLSLGKGRVTSTYTLFFAPNGSRQLIILPYGSKDMAWISVYPASIFDE